MYIEYIYELLALKHKEKGPAKVLIDKVLFDIFL